MKCPRCYRNVPEGTTVTPCCGVWVYTNGPADPGHVFYDGNKVDADLTELRLSHQAEHDDQDGAYASQHFGHSLRHDGLAERHARHATWAAENAARLQRQIWGVAALGVADFILTLLRVHV
jgi:hypothetical protein